MRSVIILMMAFLLSCQTEPKETEKATAPEHETVVVFNEDDIPAELRSGTYYPIWYKESLTTDNYLLYPLPRKQEAYNKLLVDSVYMIKIGTEEFNIDGIRHCFYDVRIKFKNQPTGSPTTYVSVLNNPNLAYVPYGVNVLHSSNPYKVMTIVKTTDKLVYPEWVTGKPKTKYKHTIKGDTTQLGSEYLFGTAPTGTAFLLPHK